MLHRAKPTGPQPAHAGNPFVVSVLRENVRVTDGRATIGVWGGWAFLLAEIPAFGKVLAISRNSHAVLGTVSDYPEMDLAPCGHGACAVDGSLEFDFTSWKRAVAIVETPPGGSLYAVEFSDVSGEVIHKICLTEQSDLEAFRCRVELSQTTAGILPDCETSWHNSWLENPVVSNAPGAQLLGTEELSVFLQTAAAEHSAFGTIVGDEGAVQTANARDPEGRFVCAVGPPYDADRGFEIWRL